MAPFFSFFWWGRPKERVAGGTIESIPPHRTATHKRTHTTHTNQMDAMDSSLDTESDEDVPLETGTPAFEGQ